MEALPLIMTLLMVTTGEILARLLGVTTSLIYHISDGQRNFDLSKKACEDLGAALTSLDSEQETDFILDRYVFIIYEYQRGFHILYCYTTKVPTFIYLPSRMMYIRTAGITQNCFCLCIYSIGCGTSSTDCDSDDGYWIGLVKDEGDLTSREGWRWLDGTEYDWQNWYPDEPNNIPSGGTGEVRMINNGEWRDYPKSAEFRYICERMTCMIVFMGYMTRYITNQSTLNQNWKP